MSSLRLDRGCVTCLSAVLGVAGWKFYRRRLSLDPHHRWRTCMDFWAMVCAYK